MQTRSGTGLYDWVQVVGVDTPYPDDVQRALSLIDKETRRLAREARQAACTHTNVNHMLLRYANGDPCIDEYRCADCDKQMPNSKRH